jgi:uncharacterized radical SAM superfamily protein
MVVNMGFQSNSMIKWHLNLASTSCTSSVSTVGRLCKEKVTLDAKRLLPGMIKVACGLTELSCMNMKKCDWKFLIICP